MQNIDWKKYILAFIITSVIFGAAFYASSYFNQRKMNELKSIQDQIAVDILSSEIQFALLEELSCKDVNSTQLSQELGNLADKIEYGEKNLTNNIDQITALKRYYSLLEIKDYQLMKKISARCGLKNVFILYFYTTKEHCAECTKEGFALDALREKYPQARVYSFDYNLVDLAAVKAMTSIYKIKDTELPALVINGKVYNGFKSVEDIEKILPSLKTLKPKTSATSTKK